MTQTLSSLGADAPDAAGLNETQLLEGFPTLMAYMQRMYARPKAPMRIAKAFESIRAA
jgi:hypothetical protein